MKFHEADYALERAIRQLETWNRTWEGDPDPSELETKDILAAAWEALDWLRGTIIGGG